MQIYVYGHAFDGRVHWTHLRCEGSKGSKGSEGSKGSGSGSAADYKKGRRWRSWIEGISAAGRSFSRLFTKPYDTESQSRNADFISIAAERQSTTLGPKGRQTCEPSGRRPVHLKNLHTEGVSKGVSRQRHPLNPLNLLSRVDGIRLLCPPLTEPYVQFSRIRLLG